MTQPDRGKNQSWKSNTWVIIALIIFFWPYGFYLMFRHARWSVAVKWLVLATFLFLLIRAASDTPTKNDRGLMSLRCTRADGSTELLENRRFDPCEGKTTCFCVQIH